MEAPVKQPKHHEHPSHYYERVEHLEAWVGKLAIPLAFVMGAAMLFGLLSSSGHVTW
jgi:hypothetical protein